MSRTERAPTPAQLKRARTRQAIVDAARAAIGRHGFAGAHVSLIARSAGVAVGSVYQHFPSRTELFAEVYRVAVTRELEVLRRASEKAPGDALQQLTLTIGTFCDRALRGGRFALALLVEPTEPLLDELRLSYRADFRALFAELIDRCVTDGSVPSAHPPIAAAALLGAMTEVLTLPRAELPPRLTREALVDELVRTCLAALGVHGGPDPAVS